MSLTWYDYAVMALYFIALVTVGTVCSLRGEKRDAKSFLLGSGKMPVFALGISCLMAALSAFSLVMVPGEIFNHGLGFWILYLIGPVFTLVAARVFMPFYFKLGSYTPFEYLEYRYSPAVRALVAGLTIYVRLVYLGMVLFSTSKIFEGAAGWPPWVSIVLIGGFALVFTTVGGLKAVVWTDVMQFVVLIGGLFCILGFLFYKIDGGFFGAVNCAFSNGRGLDVFADPGFYSGNPYVRLCFWLLLWGQFMSPISTMVSDQMTVQRLIASGSLRNAMKTQFVNTCLTIPTVVILWIIGLSVFAFYFQHPEITKPSGDTALFVFISTQLPPAVPGLVISAMMAAVISTVNAVFNSMATVYLKEFHVRYFAPQTDEVKQVKIARIATVVIGTLSIALGLLIVYSASWLKQSVVEASTLFHIFELVILPAFVFAILSRRASTTLVWVTAGLLWGCKVGTLCWYTLSTAAKNAWKPGMDLGWAGPIKPYWGIGMLIAGIVLLLLWWIVSKKSRRISFCFMLSGWLCIGCSVSVLLWSIFSNIYAVKEPQALSFQWGGVPITFLYILIGVLWLKFGPEQPKEKYQGLTLFDPPQEKTAE